MPPVPTPLAGAPDADAGQVGGAAHLGDQRRPARRGGAVVQPVDVGQQHQRVGVHEVRDQRREPVVVAEPDLVGGDGVVLVDDRHDAELEQPVRVRWALR